MKRSRKMCTTQAIMLVLLFYSTKGTSMKTVSSVVAFVPPCRQPNLGISNGRSNNSYHNKPASTKSKLMSRHALPYQFDFRHRVPLCLQPRFHRYRRPLTPLFAAADSDGIDSENPSEENETITDDKDLLKTVKASQLKELCKQFKLSTKGTKQVLLKRLRDYGSDQAAEMDDGEEGEEGVFYYSSPEKNPEKEKSQVAKSSRKVVDQSQLPTRVNENGERVVTVYSSTDQNDLTGYGAHSKPGEGFASAASNLGGVSTGGGLESLHTDSMAGSQDKKETEKEIEDARDIILGLIGQLLAMSGAPAFSDVYGKGLSPLDDDEDETDEYNGDDAAPIENNGDGFKGFDPSTVPAELLTKCSGALRTAGGQVLRESIREFEIQAVGHDGMRGDDVTKGGGHYREVRKVAAFLDGFRQAEVRRISRETCTMLINSIVEEGVQGLDKIFSTMGRGNNEGELNDALVEYLNDAVRTQEKKVEEQVAKDSQNMSETYIKDSDIYDKLDELENNFPKEETRIDGSITETLNPNDLKVQGFIAQAREYAERDRSSTDKTKTYMSGPEQILILLKLLRERVKAEAAFQGNEQGRYLRLLAYCIYSQSDMLRESIILSEVGGSLDRMDAFAELLVSSIEYAESTSHQIVPSKKSPLDVALLKKIQTQLKEIQGRQNFIANSGVSRTDPSAPR